jgi:16S rRNA (uracil1498-N3)-methyltransferase
MTERTNAARINAERWIAIATEAAEQCERLSVPFVAEPVRLPDLLGAWDPGRPLLVALERAEPEDEVGSIATWRARNPAVQPGLLIGPEGGFSAGERALLRRRPFVVASGLGPLILRAETACVAGLAALRG